MLHDLDLNHNGKEPTTKEGGALSALDIVTCEVPAGMSVIHGNNGLMVITVISAISYCYMRYRRESYTSNPI
mgnify:CR=1 FL=1